jgi:hypothetical protein
VRPATLLRLALAGTRTDTARVVLTAASTALATLAMCAALTVLAIRPATACKYAVDQNGQEVCPPGYADQYTNALLVEPGLRPGVAFALMLLCIPVLALAGQCARLGAPARDRRLSAVRLAGATPRQAVAIAVAETGLAALLGTGAGLAAYFAGRALLHRPTAAGKLPLPTDQLPPVWTLVVIGAGLPLLAAAAAALLLRRVTLSPLGVTRRQRAARPRPWAGALIALGIGAFAVLEPVARFYARSGDELPQWLAPLLLGGGGLAAMLGVVFGTAWISYAAGRVLHRLARRPAALLAARRLLADPWSGSRVLAALLACVMVGAGVAGIRALFAAEFAAERADNRAFAEAQGEVYRETPRDHAFYFRSLDLADAAVAVAVTIAGLGLLVFLVEGIVSRRRTYSALVATGLPRRTLARTVGWQVLAPAVPAIALALVTGLALVRGLSREERSGGYTTEVCSGGWERCQDASSPYLRTVEVPPGVHPVEVPFADLAAVGGVAFAALLVTLGAGLLFLRSSTDVTELRAA